ncbi:hypothetical protein [Paracidovorax avenae]|uniref:hypothetical protein n=1 Tax=Paracidovorax avenae TaxID=80867 RepID=UPI0012601A12|nr:hypothetical protein [Paracidovorax avenae]
MPVIRVKYQETIEFYREILSFTPSKHNDSRFENKNFPGILIDFTLKKNIQKNNETYLRLLFEKEFSQFCEMLSMKKVDYVILTDMMKINYVAEFRDPSGNLIVAENFSSDTVDLSKVKVID